jgi:hypothetical protein
MKEGKTLNLDLLTHLCFALKLSWFIFFKNPGPVDFVNIHRIVITCKGNSEQHGDIVTQTFVIVAVFRLP